MLASNVKQAIKSAIDMAVLPPIHLNADLWTSKVTGEKFLGVRVFCFQWLPEPEEMPVTAPSWKTVDAGLPADGFGVPDIYVEEGDKDKDADRLFVDGDGDYGEETCED